MTLPSRLHAPLGLALAACAAAALTPAWAQTPAPPVAAAPTATAAACPALLNQTFNRLQDEKPQSLCQYSGKVVLVVNTASYCGFTPQYEGLEALFVKYAGQGLVVLGFPSNDFGQQEPGQSKEIADFCFNTYGVKFPMFSKSSVVGKEANPLFATLTKATGKAPGWNFHKYLVDRQGNPVASFNSNVTPTSGQLVASIEKALAQK
jgi:glutathione peroxidase